MARLWFINPNEPEQPAKGVYRWFYLDGDKAIMLYVGQSGDSTLYRGISEAGRGALDDGTVAHNLATDFIVGTALLYFKGKGLDCFWQHISDDPGKELCFCKKHSPALQDKRGHIEGKFKLSKPSGGRWENADLDVAERKLFEQFDKSFFGQKL